MINLSGNNLGIHANGQDKPFDVSGFALMENLGTLSLANNGITAVTGLGTLKPHAKLTTIDLSRNPLQNIPDDLFSFENCNVHMNINNLSSVAKMELNVTDCLRPEHTVIHNGPSSSMRSTQLMLNAAERYSNAVQRQIKALERKSPETAQELQKHLDPQTQIQAIGDRLEAINTLFEKWEDPKRPESKDAMFPATAQYRGNSKATLRALFYGSFALRSVPGRPDVQNATGWNAISKFAHETAALSSAGTAAIPHIGGFISAPLKVGDALLGGYSGYKFNRIHRAVSQVLEPHEVESFSEGFSNGAALMMAHALPIERSGFQRNFYDKPVHGIATISGTAAEDSHGTMEEGLASGHAANAVLALAFGEAIGVSKKDAAHQLQGMTTEEKLEKALLHFCKEQKVPYKPHFFLYRPSLNEQSMLIRFTPPGS